MNRSDIDVIGNLIKSNRDPVRRGNTAQLHCLRLNNRQGDFFLSFLVSLKHPKTD